MEKENGIIENMYGEMSATIGDRTVHSVLIRKFTDLEKCSFEESNFKRLSGGTLKTLGRIVCEYAVTGEAGKKEVKFLLKYWEPVDKYIPSLLRRDSLGREREHRDYCFLEGIDSVPKAYLIENVLREQGIDNEQIKQYMKQFKILPGSIIIEFVGESTLDKKLRNTKIDERETRKKIIADVLESIVDFEVRATRKSRGWTVPQNGFGNLFDERTMSDRVSDYIRALKKYDRVEDLPPDLVKRVLKDYKTVTTNYYEMMLTPMACHGDLNTTNILIGDDGKYYFIDPKLKLRDPVIDLACLLSSPGVLLGTKEWEDLAIKFKVLGLRKMGGEPRIEGVLAPVIERLMRAKPSIGVTEEVEKIVLNSIYNQMLHNSLRNVAIITDLVRICPNRYRRNSIEDIAEMRCNIGMALGRLINEPERLGVTQEEAALYDDFRNVLQEIGVFGAEAGNKTNKNSLENEIKKKIIITRELIKGQTLGQTRGLKTPA